MVKKTDFEPLIEMSGRSYEDYPLDVYFGGGKYDPECLMQQSALIYIQCSMMV